MFEHQSQKTKFPWPQVIGLALPVVGFFGWHLWDDHRRETEAAEERKPYDAYEREFSFLAHEATGAASNAKSHRPDAMKGRKIVVVEDDKPRLYRPYSPDKTCPALASKRADAGVVWRMTRTVDVPTFEYGNGVRGATAHYHVTVVTWPENERVDSFEIKVDPPVMVYGRSNELHEATLDFDTLCIYAKTRFADEEP